ncbi:MAG TPA: hypothetical protein VLY87_05895, partial [Flavobacterium sp.]|nr:hypothetical protein [Flavobacterium sp.]
MKKRFLKLFAIGSIVISTMYGVYSYGCADGWWGSGYTSIFSPEITVNNKNYEPFFYDDYTIFYNGFSIASTTALFKTETISDWTLYLKKYTPETVEYFLYDNEVTTLLSNIARTKLIEAELKKQNFKFSLDWKDENTQKFVVFLMTSRGIETFSNQTYSYWDYDNRNNLTASQDFVTTIESLYKNEMVAKDSFLKNRMWFQVLRAKFYSDDKASAITFFNKTSNDQPKNTLYYRGLSYVAGAYKSLKNYEKSNVLFGQVFDQSKPMMPSALFDYKPLSAKEFETTIQAAPNQSTKEALYALQGYYTNGFDAMKKLYEINPSSEHLNFLLSRWVNINEQSLNIYTEYETLDVDPKKIKKEFKSKVDVSQLKWINSVADGKKTSNPYIWKATAAYFNSFVGNYKKSGQQLQDAFQLAKNQEQKGQVRSLRLLNNLLSIDDLSVASEGKLIEDVNWLFYDKVNTDYDYYTSTNRVNYLQSFTKKYVSALYKASGNKLMSELTYPIKGFYKDQKQSVAMEQLLLSHSRTAWQDLFVGVYPYKLADIYESRGIYLFYEDKIDEAIAEFEKITPFESREYNWETERYEIKMIDYKTAQLPGNPFNGKIKDCNDCDYVAKQSVKYSQLDFLKKVKEMKANIASGNDVYNNALLVGNAFYNASYFGNARAFYYNNIINEYGNDISDEHSKMLYGMENVNKYYLKAQKAATTNEEKAKMAYLFAKTERNDFYANTYFMSADGYWGYKNGVDFKKWQGFQD